MHLLDKLERPIIFAHRGASISAPENTLSAFELAVKLGARAIELDAMLSSDSIPVVIHDHTLERTTNGRGFVSDFTFADLLKLDAGAWFSYEFTGERIPTLEQVLKMISNDVLVNIELKNYHAPHDTLTKRVLQVVDGLGLWDCVLFSSFLPRNLRIIRKKKPEAKVALLCPPGFSGWLMRSSFYMYLSPEFIHPSIDDVDKKSIAKEHTKGRRVHVWTVNSKSKANELFENNIDGIFTNDPLIMQEEETKSHPR